MNKYKSFINLQCLNDKKKNSNNEINRKGGKTTCGGGGGGVRRREGEKTRRMTIGADSGRNAVTERE
jgi:hypothetical protein